MTKNFFISLLAAMVLASCSQPVKNEYVINGTLDTVFNGTVYLQKRMDAPLVTIDSAQLSGGKFSFRGTIIHPEVYYLTIPATKSSIPFFIEPAQIMVDIKTKNINNSKISGSKSQSEYDGYLDKLDQFNARIKENYQMYNTAQEVGDQEKARYFDSVITVMDKERSQFSKKFVLENPKSWVSPYIIYRNSYTYEMDDLDKALSTMDTSLSHSPYTGFMQEYLTTLKRTAIGQAYVPFSMQDSTGVNVSVSDFIGSNYLLVDFWASWCAPCREENPNLVALYGKYHEHGFDIFGVSFDSSRDRWLGAVKDDSLTWAHVSDLKGWENKAGKLYGIRSIPSNVLLDATGVIIAKNLRGDELKAKLEELFPAPVKVAKR